MLCFWWLVRVTLVVDWWILPQNFGPVVGTYEGLLWLCEWTLGGDFTSRWWGHISRICDNRSFSATGGGALKPSITFRSLGSLQLTPAHSSSLPACSPVRSSSLPSSLQLTPQFAPAHSSLLPSSLQLAPTLPHSPLHPTGGGDPNTYMAIGNELAQAWSELGAGSELGVSWSKLGAS